MDMNYQQRAEYIEQCRRQVDESRRQYLRQTHEHEMELLRIRIQAAVEMQRMFNDAHRKACCGGTSARITVAM